MRLHSFPTRRSSDLEQPAQLAERLDRWLAGVMPGLSRARLQAIITAGGVLVDGRVARPSVRLKTGQAISVRLPAPQPAVPLPEDIPLSVVYEDSHLLVVDKPAGLEIGRAHV